VNYSINLKYSVYSEAIIFHLLRSSKKYNDLFCERHPSISGPLSNFYLDENCGCRSVIYKTYKQLRFPIDLMTVEFINSNPDCIDIDEFCSTVAEKDLSGTMFSIPATESDLKDFLSKVRISRGKYSGFNTINLDDRIIITFF